MPTHYEVLGVQSTSEQEVIDAAYKALMRKYHPDRAGDNERSQQINAAYEVLRSPIKRKAYDTALKFFPARDIVRLEQQQRSERPDSAKDLQGNDPNSSEPNSRKRCTDCGEQVARSALVCRYCGYRFRGSRFFESAGQRFGCILIILLFGLVLILAGESADQPEVLNEIGATEAGDCAAGTIEVVLGDVAPKGTLQILARKAETDGYNQLVVGLSNGACVNRAELDELVASTGFKGPVQLLIGHDPKGTLYEFRHRFTYETDGTTPLSDMPAPPKDMHFGEAIYPLAEASSRLEIEWYDDFREWQAREHELASTDTVAAKSPVLESVGACETSTIAWVGTRLENSPGTGSALRLANDIYVVSYETVAGVENSHVGDQVQVCLAAVPKNCPAGDDRGKEYAMLNARTGESWQLADSSHICGGA